MDSIPANRRLWNQISSAYQRKHDPQIGATPRLWGMYSIPDAHLHALGDVTGKRVLELGCGAGQWSRALAAEGATVVGLDLSEAQLAAAARAMGAARYPLVQGADQRRVSVVSELTRFPHSRRALRCSGTAEARGAVEGLAEIEEPTVDRGHGGDAQGVERTMLLKKQERWRAAICEGGDQPSGDRCSACSSSSDCVAPVESWTKVASTPGASGAVVPHIQPRNTAVNTVRTAATRVKRTVEARSALSAAVRR
ncbi:methyltransferase domain-containing protein [Streptomyces sp. NPDC052127]|uniref:class I SAM-dependent methyltransferase n=1 Tax=Streptomyces sp. NPDC052127 TaxID=3155679 RepID=UPI00342A05DB